MIRKGHLRGTDARRLLEFFGGSAQVMRNGGDVEFAFAFVGQREIKRLCGF
jgi:hypothetical protein